MSSFIVLPAIFESIRSLKDRSYKLVFETNEITPEQLSSLGQHIQNPGYLAFNKDVFKKEMLDAIESQKTDYEDIGKSKSERLRNVLYVFWKQKNDGYAVFDDFYNANMEKLITHYKNRLI
jgi:hypothetical protein